MPRKVMVWMAGAAMLGLIPLVSLVYAQESSREEPLDFRYDRHGRPNPFVPLIIPTPTPTQVATPTPTPTRTPKPGEVLGPPPTPTPTPFQAPPVNLEAVIFMPGHPVAIIDGVLREVGDTFGDQEISVRHIDQQKVILELRGHQWTRYVPGNWYTLEPGAEREEDQPSPAPGAVR